MGNNISCPKCGGLTIKQKFTARMKDLFLGEFFILLSALIIILFLKFGLNDQDSLIMLIVPILGLPAGIKYYSEYFNALQSEIITCKCFTCGFKWKQSIPSEKSEKNDSLEEIRKCLQNKSIAIKIDTAESLGNLQDHESIDDLIAMLEENYDDKIKIRITKALANMGKPVVKHLISELENINDDKVKRYIVQALGRTKDKDIIKPLFEEYEKTDDNALKEHIVYALGMTGDKQAVPLLIDSIKKFPDSRILLQRITGKDFKYNVKKWKEWWKENNSGLSSNEMIN